MVFVVGAVAIDMVAVRERFLDGTSNPSDIRLGLGGVGYRIFSNLEAPRRFITALASDPISRWARQTLEADGDVAIQVVSSREAGPPLYLAIMESGSLKVGASDLRIIEQSLTVEFVVREIGSIGPGDFLVLDANLSAALLASLVQRFAARTRVVFEPVSAEKSRRHAAALRNVFLMTPTVEEWDALCAEDPAAFMTARGLENVLVTRGEEGTRLYRAGTVEDFAPRTVMRTGDTTGAGDSLLAALLSFLHDGREMRDAVRAAMDRVERRLEKETS